MVNSLGDHNIALSSSADIKNIKWIQRNSKDANKPKKKKREKKSPTNIIYTEEIKTKSTKFFKIEETPKLEKKKTSKKFQNSSASICKIKQGFKRPGR